MQNTTLKELKVMKEMRSNLVLVGSGFLLPLGVIILVWYFIDYIFKSGGINTGKQYIDNTYNIANVNIRPGPDVSDKDDFDTPMDHMSKESREEMR